MTEPAESSEGQRLHEIVEKMKKVAADLRNNPPTHIGFTIIDEGPFVVIPKSRNPKQN